MRPTISEFSYGYALIDELINWQGTRITAAPVFPSLYDEGREGEDGGGWDVKLSRPSMPLFIQFKLSHYMKGARAKEIEEGLFSSPYYRMHLRTEGTPNQHQMLLDLEKRGEEVYYSAPTFYQKDDFNEAYVNKEVKKKSKWIRPSEIGSFTDNGPHYVAFQSKGSHYVMPEKRELYTEGDFEVFAKIIESSFQQSAKLKHDELYYSDLAAWIRSNLEKTVRFLRADYESSAPLALAEGYEFEMIGHERDAKHQHPIQEVANYCSIFLDTRVFIVQSKTQ